MVIYKIKYMHGDADLFVDKEIKIESILKNKLIEFALEIYKKISDNKEFENLFGEIDRYQAESYIEENCPEVDFDDELIDEIIYKLKEERAIYLYNLLKENRDLDKFDKNTLKEINNIINVDINTVIDKDKFYQKIFDFCWDLIVDDIFEQDVTCNDYFAEIYTIKVQNSFYEDIISKLSSLSREELINLKSIIDKKLI